MSTLNMKGYLEAQSRYDNIEPEDFEDDYEYNDEDTDDENQDLFDGDDLDIDDEVGYEAYIGRLYSDFLTRLYGG